MLSDKLRTSASNSSSEGLYKFTQFTFNAGLKYIGRYPSFSSEFLENYDTTTFSWLKNSKFWSSVGGRQLWTVPETATYRISCLGGAGGEKNQTARPGSGKGGRGAKVEGDFNLIKGQKIVISVGNMGDGKTNTKNYTGAGGGGATYVFNLGIANQTLDQLLAHSKDIAYNYILIIAGGGGGGVEYSTPINGGDGLGTYDNSGGRGAEGPGTYAGSGGAGVKWDGTNGLKSTTGGLKLWAAGSGGKGYGNSSYGGDGGFGGGGGAGFAGAGGGGGSSGGNGGYLNTNQHSWGGTSWNTGNNKYSESGVNTWSGECRIQKL